MRRRSRPSGYRYLEWAGGDREHAVALYTLNAQLSEALYIPMQMLEVALRNRIHTVFSSAFGQRWVFDKDLLPGDWQSEQLDKAIDEMRSRNKETTAGRIVAELTFGFWTAMLGAGYEVLWQTHLHRIARRSNGKGLRRKDLSGPITPIRILRNRVAHHEPILSWNLPKHYQNIIDITEWLSPPAAIWCRAHCRFSEVHPAGRIHLITGGSK